MRPLTKLERYGWEHMARERLGITVGESRILAQMTLEASGRLVGKETLQELLGGRRGPRPLMKTLCKPLGRIRAALADVGIVDAVRCWPEEGYSVWPDLIPHIRTFVEDEV